MSSELFIALQENLRNYKNNHGIDMLHPNGVIIHGKPYPAVEKRVFLNLKSGSKSVGYTNSFDIPMENGHRVDVRHSDWPLESGVTTELSIPTRYHFHDLDTGKTSGGNYYRTVPDMSPLDPSHYSEINKALKDTPIDYKIDANNKEGFHKTMQTWSKLPRFGLEQTHSMNTKTGQPSSAAVSGRLMNDTELNEHFNDESLKIKDEKTPQHIDVYMTNDTNNQMRNYTYNIKTEQLTTDEEWD